MAFLFGASRLQAGVFPLNYSTKWENVHYFIKIIKQNSFPFR
jgi:hypothetical protein